MSALHLFPHVVDELSAMFGAPTGRADRWASWTVRMASDPEAHGPKTLTVRWSPARPERVEAVASTGWRRIAATTEPLLMREVVWPEAVAEQFARWEAT